jgi:hypothetical protein
MEIFISYAREDRDALTELKGHLSWVIREHRVTLWDDSGILPGREWGRAIDVRLETADMILLLVSRHFLASDYCHAEMVRALARHTAGEAHVIPILLQPCDFETAPFAMLQLLPGNGRPISVWEHRDEAYVSVVQGIRAALSSLHLRTGGPRRAEDDREGPASDIGRLRAGTQSWNAWRAANPRITPNLAGAVLRGADLSDANLARANLTNADLSFSILDRADLRAAVLVGVALTEATLRRANLENADLTRANLDSVVFESTILDGVRLSGAKKLETAILHGRSRIDERALSFTADLPERFLRGCGLTDDEIAAYRSRGENRKS